MSSGARLVREIADAPERVRALDPEQSFLVQAPAGSGKTELLIQRYLRLLARVEEPEGVVAITFTRKAAGEMQQRVLAALEIGAQDEEPEAPHERLTWELAQAVLEQDRVRQWRLQENPSRLRMMTIDSLCASITRQMPWLARLGAQPEVTESAAMLYRQAARETIRLVESEDAWAESLAVLLAHLDNQAGRLEQLLVTMLGRRDQWWESMVLGGSPEHRERLESALTAILEDHLERLRNLVPEQYEASLVASACYAASNLTEGHITACRDLTELPGAGIEQLPVWLGIAELLLKSDDEWRKSANKNCGFPAASSAKTTAAKALYKEQKEAVESLFDALSFHDELREALALTRSLPPASYSDEQWQVMSALFDVLKLAAGQLLIIFREHQLVDFVEVARAARLALADREGASTLAVSLDAKIQHLLVDEFQDTSMSQFELLWHLTTDWQPGDGRTLFLVGDPMQSIYRFRQAEVALFLRAQQQPINAVQTRFLRLSANFRSVPAIVDWVNATFQQVFPSTADAETSAVPYSESVPARSGGVEQAVVVHPFCPADPAAEAERVVELIRESQMLRPEGDIAVLVRARPHLSKIVELLQQEGIAYRAVDIVPLSERPVVQDLLSLTRALLHLADRTAWLSILRAPWCGLTLHDLHLVAQSRPRAAIWDCLHSLPEGLTDDGRLRLRRFLSVLDQSFAVQGRMTVRRWVEQTWIALGGPACLDQDRLLDDAADYLDLLEKESEGGGLPDLDAFQQRVESLYARPSAAADTRLHVMTIHKAKGLQFDTVIIPGLGRKPRADEEALLLSSERPRGDGSHDTLLAPIKETGTEQDPMYSYLRILEQRKARHEALRLLYVGATRAKQELHLIGGAMRAKDGSLKAPPGSFLDHLWPVLKEEFEARFAGAVDHTEDVDRPAPPPLMLRRLPADWTPPPLPPAIDWHKVEAEESTEVRVYRWASDTLRHVGTVVHDTLRRIGEDGMAGWNETRLAGERPLYATALRRLGVPEDECEGAVDRVIAALTGTLNSERGRWLLQPREGAQCEFPVSGRLPDGIEHAVIDRTFVDDDGLRWIIDYKSSDHQGAGRDEFLDNEQRLYQPQLERYAALLKRLHGGPLRVALYFPLLDAWREWEPGDLHSGA